MESSGALVNADVFDLSRRKLIEFLFRGCRMDVRSVCGSSSKQLATMCQASEHYTQMVLQVHACTAAMQLAETSDGAGDPVRAHGKGAVDFNMSVPAATLRAAQEGELVWRVQPSRGTNMKRRLVVGARVALVNGARPAVVIRVDRVERFCAWREAVVNILAECCEPKALVADARNRADIDAFFEGAPAFEQGGDVVAFKYHVVKDEVESGGEADAGSGKAPEEVAHGAVSQRLRDIPASAARCVYFLLRA